MTYSRGLEGYWCARCAFTVRGHERHYRDDGSGLRMYCVECAGFLDYVFLNFPEELRKL